MRISRTFGGKSSILISIKTRHSGHRSSLWLATMFCNIWQTCRYTFSCEVAYEVGGMQYAQCTPNGKEDQTIGKTSGWYIYIYVFVVVVTYLQALATEGVLTGKHL